MIGPKLAIVIPVFNEAESLNPFWNELNLVLDNLLETHEVIFVNDGSTDESLEILMGFQTHNVKVINLLVNAGHMAALDAGYRQANAKWIVSMDADLHHPPSVIPK